MNNYLKMLKSVFQGKFYARKFCAHCEEDYSNLCMKSYISNARNCTLFKKYIFCKGRDSNKDDRWIY